MAQKAQEGGEAVPEVALEFQNPVFDGAAGAELLFEVGEKRRLAVRVKVQSFDDRDRFSRAAAFLEPDHGGFSGGRERHALFSQKKGLPSTPQPLPDFLK